MNDLSIPAKDEPTKNGKYKGYKEASSNKVKVAIILREESKFLHMRQLTQIAQSLEPGEDPESIKGKIQQAVYNLKASGSVVNVVVGKSNLNVFWGSKSWLDENGKIKPNHLYDENELSINKNESIEI